MVEHSPLNPCERGKGHQNSATSGVAVYARARFDTHAPSTEAELIENKHEVKEYVDGHA